MPHQSSLNTLRIYRQIMQQTLPQHPWNLPSCHPQYLLRFGRTWNLPYGLPARDPFVEGEVGKGLASIVVCYKVQDDIGYTFIAYVLYYWLDGPSLDVQFEET